MPYAPTEQNRGGELLGAGIASFGRSMGEGIQKYKQRRQEYKGLQQYADATGIAPKEVSDTMSLEELKGHVGAEEYKRFNMQREQQIGAQKVTDDANKWRFQQDQEAVRRGDLNRKIYEGYQAETAKLGPQSPQEFTTRLQGAGLAPEYQDAEVARYKGMRAIAPPPEVAPAAPPGMIAGKQSVRTPSGSVYDFEPPAAPKAPMSTVLAPATDLTGKPIPGVAMDARGGVHNLPVGAAGSGGVPSKLTADQLKNRGFSGRLDLAEKEIKTVQDAGFNPQGAGAAAGSMAPGFAQSGNQQRFNAASENWISAVLRRESGAAISEGERLAARNEYFPRLGDKPETIAAKAALRQQVARDMRESGGGAEEGSAPAQAAPKEAPSEKVAGKVYQFPDGIRRRFKGGDSKDKKNWEPV